MMQKEFKFDRFGRKEQLDALDALQLPSLGGVRAMTLKAVLRAIEGHARGEGQCWATQETIASEIGVRSVRTVKRAVAALQAVNLITSERIALGWGRWVNHHTVVWQEILDRLNQPPKGDILSPSLVTESHLHRGQKVTFIGDRESPSMGSESHLPYEKRQLNVNRTATSNGAREEEAEGQEIFQQPQEQQEQAMAKRTTRKAPEARPILEADYAAAPTEHRTPPAATSFPRTNKRHDQPGAWTVYEQQRVEDTFRAAGHGGPRLLVETAIARGLQPEDCDAAVEQLHSSVDAKTRQPLGPAALDWRIKQGTWPCTVMAKADLASEKPVESPDEIDRRRRAKQAAELQQLEARAKVERARFNERNARLGAILDALPEAELAALLARVPAFWSEGVNRRFSGARPITFGPLRDDLFSLLEKDGTDGR